LNETKNREERVLQEEEDLLQDLSVYSYRTPRLAATEMFSMGRRRAWMFIEGVHESGVGFRPKKADILQYHYEPEEHLH
jgi:hypothetical protein